MSNNSITDDFTDIVCSFGIDKVGDQDLSRALESAKMLIEGIEGKLVESSRLGLLGNLLFANHGYYHSSEMSKFLAKYFNCLKEIGIAQEVAADTLNSGYSILTFITLLLSSVMLHDISMCALLKEFEANKSTMLAEIVINQDLRRDHVTKTIIYVNADYFNNSGHYIPKILWDTTFDLLGSNGTNALYAILRICKAHGDDDNIWLTPDSLKNIHIDIDGIRKIEYAQSDACSIFSENGATIDASLWDVVKYASAFLCLADMCHIGNRFKIDELLKKGDVFRFFLKMDFKKRNLFMQHMISDLFVNRSISKKHYDSMIMMSKIANRYNVNIVYTISGEKAAGIPAMIRKWIPIFISHVGAIATLDNYSNNYELRSILSRWRCDEFCIKRKEAGTDHYNSFNKFSQLLNMLNTELMPDNFFKEYYSLWKRILINRRTIEEKYVSNFLGMYYLINFDESITGLEAKCTRIAGASEAVHAMNANIPLDYLVDLSKEGCEAFHYNRDVKVIIFASDVPLYNFLGAVQLSKEYMAAICNFNLTYDKQPKLRWLEKSGGPDYQKWLDHQAGNNVVILDCLNGGIISDISTIIKHNVESPFLVITRNENQYESLTQILRSDSIIFNIVKPYFKIEHLSDIMRFGKYIFSKDSESKYTLTTEIIEENKLDVILQELNFEYGGSKGLVDKICNNINHNDYSAVLLLHIFLLLCEQKAEERTVKGKVYYEVDHNTLKEYYTSINNELKGFFEFQDMQGAIDSVHPLLSNNCGNYRIEIKSAAALKNRIADILRMVESSIGNHNKNSKNLIERNIELIKRSILLLAHNFASINLTSPVFMDSIKAFNSTEIVDFIRSGSSKLEQRHALAIISLLIPIPLSIGDKKVANLVYSTNSNVDYLKSIITQLLADCEDLLKDYDFIVFQSLYQLLVNVIICCESTHTIDELYENFCKNKMFMLSLLEVSCSKFAHDKTRLSTYIEKSIKMITLDNSYPNIRKFSFDIIYEYGAREERPVNYEPEIWNNYNSCYGSDVKKYKKCCMESRRIMEADDNSYGGKDKLLSTWIDLRKCFFKVMLALPPEVGERTILFSKYERYRIGD